ncbi:MAG: NAD-dependent malic enzyme [Candidatus Desulforudis sp.]|nr:NAD-dependent malic enzyme [Desulforudis sp.]
MDCREEALQLHKELKGKIEIVPKRPLRDQHDLSLLYTPGVAAPSLEINRDPDLVYEYTAKGNTVAIVTDGTAVLGLGDLGPLAALPVMEGKALLFNVFAEINAFPLCLATSDPDEVVSTVQSIAPSFGGINLEDIAAPACFEIERRLKESLDIPVFHDDQHGTAVVVAAGLVNALKLTGRRIGKTKVVISGAGAAGVATARLFLRLGVRHLLVCDRRGVVFPGRTAGMNPYKQEIAEQTNPAGSSGSLADALRGADVFVGLSRVGLVTREMVRTMAPDPIVFALANPEPEISRTDALAAGAAVVATGGSECPNQINNVLAFPGIFRGALDVRATDINGEMKVAATAAISELVGDDLSPEYIIPRALDRRVVEIVAGATAAAAVKSGINRSPRH